MAREIFRHLRRDMELLLRQAKALPRRLGEGHSALAVRLARARHLGNAFSDQRLGNDQLRLALGRFGNFVRSEEFLHILTIHFLHAPSIGLETRPRVFALREKRHGVQCHIVRVIDKDEIVQLKVAGQRTGLARHPFLQTSVAGQTDHLVVEDGVLRRVETRRAHHPRHGEAHRVGHALAEGTGCCLDPRRFREFRMPRGHAVQLAELLQVVQRDVIAREMQPRVKKHAPVARGENESVAVQPPRLLRIVTQRSAEKNGPDFRAAKRQPEVTGFAGGDGIDGEAAGIARGQSENFAGQGHSPPFSPRHPAHGKQTLGILMHSKAFCAKLLRRK